MFVTKFCVKYLTFFCVNLKELIQKSAKCLTQNFLHTEKKIKLTKIK